MSTIVRLSGICAALLVLHGYAAESGESSRGPLAWTFKEAEARMQPFDGVRAEGGVDPNTLEGKLIAGYQGWFNTPYDGSGRGWAHYSGKKNFEPGTASVDMWPDMSEADEDEKSPTGFRHEDGSMAYVFSSYNRKTVMRHFKWMAEYGIDGVFVQRFVSNIRNPERWDNVNAVLDNCRHGANAYGRTWAVMYDLSGAGENELAGLIKRDWITLAKLMQITKDPSYQKHNGKPLVILWGVGFGGDKRKYTLKECAEVIDFLKNDPDVGGNSVMLGIPSGWRKLVGDSIKDKYFHEVIRMADIISPWSVGRYKDTAGFQQRLKDYGRSDMVWARENKIAYMPVIFPGFSWKNLMTLRGNTKVVKDAIPRGDGSFFWQQGISWIREGAGMIYVAMFDELDEGTAIFKTSNNPPPDGLSVFVTNGEMPPDHFLWLSGSLSRMLKGTLPITDEVPKRGFE